MKRVENLTLGSGSHVIYVLRRRIGGHTYDVCLMVAGWERVQARGYVAMRLRMIRRELADYIARYEGDR